jgi:hypothetical protein
MQAVNPSVNPAMLINEKPLCFVIFLNAVLKNITPPSYSPGRGFETV